MDCRARPEGRRGQPLAEVETDKATMEVESAVSGVLQEVRSPAGEAVSVGQVIAVLEVEQVPGAVSGGSVPTPRAAKPAVAPASAGQPVPATAPARGMFGATGRRPPLLRPQRRP